MKKLTLRLEDAEYDRLIAILDKTPLASVSGLLRETILGLEYNWSLTGYKLMVDGEWHTVVQHGQYVLIYNSSGSLVKGYPLHWILTHCSMDLKERELIARD